MAYTTIDDPSAHFQVVTYTGAGNSSSVTFGGNSDLQPDWLWVKRRDSSDNSKVFDTSRGIGSGSEPYLTTVSTEEEQTYAYLTSVDSDGFTWDTVDSSVGASSNTYVAWAWKANGGTTTSQTGSDINSVTQANTTSKFSIITYTGASNADSDSDNNSGAYWRVKHGLGSTPKLAIFKKRSSAAAWYVWHHKIGGTLDYKYLQLQGTNAVQTENAILFGNTDWSSTEFEIGGWDVVNRDSSTYVAYMFDEVQGYSKFGSYTGNGNADGPFIYLGFKPAWVMVKRTNTTGAWEIYDSARNGNDSNPINDRLRANDNAAENTDDTSDYVSDFLSNGWKIRTNSGNWNTSGHTYIYIAFAEHPFVSSKGVPVTAR